MRFQVPQFIDRETKIAGPLTFKQFAMVVTAGGLILVAYLYLAKINSTAFTLVSIGIVGTALSLAFVRINGRDLPQVLGNVASFFTGPKVYLWKKKELPPRIIWKKAEEKKGKAPEPAPSNLKIAERSRLKQMAVSVETRR